MFTGLIQKLGALKQRARIGDAWSLAIQCEPWDEPLRLGESVAVQGVCLTVTQIHEGGGFTVDLLDETLARTALGRLPANALLNLERALRFSDRLGGHIVSGHVDECGRVARVETRGRDHAVRVACSAAFARQCVLKGSVALDGISLTLAGLGDDWLEVHIIPHTWQHTSLRERAPGDPVNLESDLVGKYVQKFSSAAPSPGVTESLLKNAGF